ncbi:DNA-binding protein [Knoellia sinensis KCTC 19936]|uniref:DNA-binding protein n=1 Tax=Knoellia sinensis KCTC 19936 TaxID=1385520 RepID=A0A0A0J769_9MICO|nr:septation protein SepH [Knoellia sinensis]KGN33230.1 DNA-binding protein [Knoellia sinensis KCTC 19936]
MMDLRLIGVHEDGEHVLLSDAEGKRYRAPLDEAMRAAARRDRPRLGQLQIEIDGGLRPRDVQALIRSGLSTEEVADRAGWTIQKVQRFEGPVLAEREYIANLARAVIVGQTRPGSRAGNQTAEQSLGSRADERLKERGVLAERVRWDSLRLDDGRWTVTAHFPAGGRERIASWTFDPRLKSLLSGNDEARWLSEDSTGDSAIPTPHVATNANRASAVFDVEAAGGVKEEAAAEGADSSDSSDSSGPSAEPIDLMAAMREQSTRSRRSHGRRRSSPTHTPVDESPRDDALPLEELTMDPAEAPEPPAARGKHPVSAHLDDRAHDVDDVTSDEDSDSTETLNAAEARETAKPGPPAQAPARKSGSRKAGRPTVPSWDDIMFGGGRSS